MRIRFGRERLPMADLLSRLADLRARKYINPVVAGGRRPGGPSCVREGVIKVYGLTPQTGWGAHAPSREITRLCGALKLAGL
jgi:hypothetical protein